MPTAPMKSCSMACSAKLFMGDEGEDMDERNELKKYRVMVTRRGFVEFWAESEEEALDNTDCMSWNDVDWDEFDSEMDAIVVDVEDGLDFES